MEIKAKGKSFWLLMKGYFMKFLSGSSFSYKRGQITVEYLLLAVVLTVLFKVATDTLKNNGYLDEFRNTPADRFRNMAQNGNWKKKNEERQSKDLHPNQFNSHRQSKGKGP